MLFAGDTVENSDALKLSLRVLCSFWSLFLKNSNTVYSKTLEHQLSGEGYCRELLSVSLITRWEGGSAK